MTRKVFVSGCFDLLHSGHVAFLEQASSYGDLYVALGSDKTVIELKGRPPINNEQERLYMLNSLKSVKRAIISRGSGILDFQEVFDEVSPDVFIVNEDGNLTAKQELCKKYGVEYVVLQRTPRDGLEARSTTALRKMITMPFRIDIAGGWLDQPYVSKHYPGPVITISIEPTVEFNDRSGMASSTRHRALDLWGPRLPQGDPGKLANILFCYDNPPGTPHVSGSQDAIGIVFPGLNISHYNGDYWPERIDSVNDEDTLQFIEKAIYMIPLGPRGAEYDVLSNTRIDRQGAKALSDATLACWNAIMRHDVVDFGRFFRSSFQAQIDMFPHMMNDSIAAMIDRYRDQALGWKLSGAGGGGYLILIAEQPIEHGIRINIRRAG